jgi:hypothetical protein
MKQKVEKHENLIKNETTKMRGKQSREKIVKVKLDLDNKMKFYP